MELPGESLPKLHHWLALFVSVQTADSLTHRPSYMLLTVLNLRKFRHPGCLVLAELLLDRNPIHTCHLQYACRDADDVIVEWCCGGDLRAADATEASVERLGRLGLFVLVHCDLVITGQECVLLRRGL